MGLFPFLVALLSAILFGAAAPLSKTLLAQFSPNQLAGLLYLGAALGLLPWALRGPLRFPWQLDARTRRLLIGVIVCGGLLGPVFLLLALKVSSAASVSLLLNCELIATALLGVAFFRDWLDRRGWAAVGLATSGAVLLTGGAGLSGGGAVVLALLACACWGLDNHMAALIDAITPMQTTLCKGLAAGSVNLALGLWMSPWSPGEGAVAQALALGALSYGASITLFISAAQRLGATRTQAIFATAPFFGVLFAVGLQGERISPNQFFSGLLFLAAAVLLALERHRHAHEHEVLEHEHRHSHDDGHHDHRHSPDDSEREHVHRHGHERGAHSHPHRPDLHHRHRHH